MATWSGFSDAEVSKIKVKLQDAPKASPKVKRCEPKLKEEPYRESQNVEEKSEDTKSSVVESEMTETEDSTPVSQTEAAEDENKVVLKESLEVLQEHQERLKQENLQRKLQIEQALKERYKKSSKEVETLHFVQKELSKIDDLVTHDVGILRKRIEEADRVYNNAKKRLSAAEKEYVAAKLALYDAKEKKELLSEHLCSIIQHNESRKAQKLNQLMSDLHLGGDSSSAHASGTISDKANPPVGEPIPLGASMINIQRMD